MRRSEIFAGVKAGIRQLLCAQARLSKGKKLTGFKENPHFEFRCLLYMKLGKVKDLKNLKVLDRTVDAFLESEGGNNSSPDSLPSFLS